MPSNGINKMAKHVSLKARLRPAGRLFRYALRYFGVDAWASAWGTIYYNPAVKIRRRLVRHELAHIEQMARLGRIRMTWLWLCEYRRVGYYDNRFEVEARLRENDRHYAEDEFMDGREVFVIAGLWSHIPY